MAFGQKCFFRLVTFDLVAGGHDDLVAARAELAAYFETDPAIGTGHNGNWLD